MFPLSATQEATSSLRTTGWMELVLGISDLDGTFIGPRDSHVHAVTKFTKTDRSWPGLELKVMNLALMSSCSGVRRLGQSHTFASTLAQELLMKVSSFDSYPTRYDKSGVANPT